MTTTARTDVEDDRLLTFADGIPGFPEAKRFALVDLAQEGAFQLLQSLDDPDVALIVCVPWLFFPDYAPVLDSRDQQDLGIDHPEDAIVFCAVTVGDEETLYLNLLGPFVINAQTRQGRQVVLADGEQPTSAAVPLPA
jgi:flagellar assembly factor FliW